MPAAHRDDARAWTGRRRVSGTGASLALAIETLSRRGKARQGRALKVARAARDAARVVERRAATAQRSRAGHAVSPQGGASSWTGSRQTPWPRLWLQRQWRRDERRAPRQDFLGAPRTQARALARSPGAPRTQARACNGVPPHAPRASGAALRAWSIPRSSIMIDDRENSLRSRTRSMIDSTVRCRGSPLFVRRAHGCHWRSSWPRADR